MPVAAVEDFMRASTVALIFFGVPVVAIIAYNRRKIEEARHRVLPQQNDQNTQQQIAALQAKVDNLTMIVQEHIIDNDRSQAKSVEQRLNQ